MLLVEGLSSCLTGDVIKHCKDKGIKTVLDFLSADTEALAQKISVPYKDIASIQRVLLACYSSFAQSGESLYDEQLQSLSILNTGSHRLDEYLHGGIYTGEITEIHGLPGSGKSQLCLNVAAYLIAIAGGSVLYIDSGGNFSATRFRQILSCRVDDPQFVEDQMKNLRVIHVYDVDELFDILHFINGKICQQDDDDFYSCLKLVVLDSVTPLISPCLGSKYFEGQGLMAVMAQQLKCLSSEHSLSVMVCNNMVQGKDYEIKPALGKYWSYVPSVSLAITRQTGRFSDDSRSISICKSCRKEKHGEIIISVTDDGIKDSNVL